MITAGDHIVTAEFRESRAELAADMANKKAAVQSPAISLAVNAGVPHKVSLEAANQPQRLTVTNAAAVKERLLLKAAAVQVIGISELMNGGLQQIGDVYPA